MTRKILPTIIFLCFLRILSVSPSDAYQFAQKCPAGGGPTFITGNITQNTTWALSGSPYIIQGNITVLSGKTLTINPCVKVKFDGNYELHVNGKLSAVGTASNNIVFTSNEAVPTIGFWNQIYFDDPSDSSSSINYCRIEYAKNGVYVFTSNPPISNSVFQNNLTGIRLRNTVLSPITNNRIENNTQYGIAMEEEGISGVPRPTINNNIIKNNGLYSVFITILGVNFNHSSVIINAEYNWWGTNDPALISAAIWDNADDIYRLKVDFIPFYTGDPATTISILNNSVTNKFFDPQLNQTATINYYINSAANITIRIYDWEAQTLVRTLINNQHRAAGANSEIFDGKDDFNQTLTEAVYVYTINAQDAGGRTGSYDPAFSPGGSFPLFNVNVTPQGAFSAFKGYRLAVNYDLQEPALVTLGFTNQPDFVGRKPRDSGDNVDYWDGRDNSGNIAAPSGTEDIQAMTEKLPENIIIVQDEGTLDVTLLTSDPYVIRPLYNETTQISYTINEAADVTVSILSEDGSQVLNTIEPANPKSAGTYTLTWDGKTSSGETVTQEGDYRIRVQAVNASSGSKIRDGNIRVLP